MKNVNRVFLIIVLNIIMISCSMEPELLNPESEEGLLDYGYIPASLENFPENQFQSAIYYNEKVFVATSDGVWKNDLKTKTWSRSGLNGKMISCIYQHPTIASKFFAGTVSNGSATDKTLYISFDSGNTWNAASSPIFDKANNTYETYVCIAVSPLKPDIIFANLYGGATIAVSKDGGQTWNRKNYMQDSYFGYASAILFLQNNPNQIFQGSENPLDDAWLGRYDINSSDPVMLSNFQKIVGLNTWSNRRPNELQTYSNTPNDIFVGQEGALSKVTGNQSKFIYNSNGNNFPYTYIMGIWVDPNNSKHILFGGFNKDAEIGKLGLYETLDEGEKITRISNPVGMTNPIILEIVNTNTYPAVLVIDPPKKKMKLLLYRIK